MADGSPVLDVNTADMVLESFEQMVDALERADQPHVSAPWETDTEAVVDEELAGLEVYKGDPTIAQVAQAIYIAGYAKRKGAELASPWEALQGRAKAWIGRALMAMPDGGTVKTDAGSAWLVGSTEVISYDAKALTALCKSSPELERILAPHRKVTKKAGYVSVLPKA